jgi:mannonate dehydratase
VNRRNFIRATALTALAAVETSGCATGPLHACGTGKADLRLGTQHGDSDDILKAMAAFGVNHICVQTPKKDEWSVEALTARRAHIESFGVKADALRLLHPSAIDGSAIQNVMLGKSPERDQEIDALCQKIRNASKAGYTLLTYDLSILGEVRTKSKPGRGGASCGAFNYAESTDRDKPTLAGVVSTEALWERIDYFVQRVIPVAEECKVRLGLHPTDPAMPEPQGFRGVHTPLSTVAGLKRFVRLHPSPYHGLNFCQGTICESMKNPREEIYEAIEWFGSRGRIFNVHFRNITGGYLNFQETFPDNGDVDFIRAIRAYKRVGYRGMLMPDHVPVIDGDTGKKQAFAYSLGYIQALIQMVNREGAP